MNNKAEQLNIFHIDFNYVNYKIEYIYEWLPRIADMGFNAILWELEDKIQWELCPECVWPEAMTKDEFRKLLEFSISLGLEPIPLLQTIGHAEYILLHDKYKSFRELPDRYDCYCTENSDVREFLLHFIKEYLDLFGNIRFFHLGGDEAYVFGSCNKCSSFVAEHSKNELYNRHINALSVPLLKRKIRPGIWNDMIMSDPGSLNLFSKDFIIWDWNYWDTDLTPEAVIVRGKGRFKKEELNNEILQQLPEVLDDKQELRQFYSVKTVKQMGFDVILCSAASAAGDNFYCPSPVRTGNVVGAASVVASEELMGNCVTSWAIRLNDYIVQIPFIGLAAFALQAPGKGSRILQYEYCKKLFGCEPEKFITASEILGISLPFAQAHSTSVQWDRMKGSLSAPDGYLRQYLETLKGENPQAIKIFSALIQEALDNIPTAIKSLTEFFQEAKSGWEIIEYWLRGAEFLIAHALIGRMILADEKQTEIIPFIKLKKDEYVKFLSRRETTQSAEKNAGLVFDSLIGFFENC